MENRECAFPCALPKRSDHRLREAWKRYLEKKCKNNYRLTNFSKKSIAFLLTKIAVGKFLEEAWLFETTRCLDGSVECADFVFGYTTRWRRKRYFTVRSNWYLIAFTSFTGNLCCVRTAFNVLVVVLDSDFVLSGGQWQVRNGYGAVLVVVAANFSLAGTFDSQRKTSWSCVFGRNGKVARFTTDSVSQAGTVSCNEAAAERVDKELERWSWKAWGSRLFFADFYICLLLFRSVFLPWTCSSL